MIFELPDCFLHISLVYLLLTRIFRIGGNALENFIVCLNAVAPIFIIIALGYMARRLGDIKREDVFRFNRLIFRYFIPVMVFYNIYVSDLAASFNVKLLCFALLGVLAEWFVSMQIVKRTERRRKACGQRRCRDKRAVLTDAFPVGNDLQNCWCNIGDKNE